MEKVIQGEKKINKKDSSDRFSLKRCNAVSFESNVCEEAQVMELENINDGEQEKDFLIRSDEIR